MKRKVTNLNSVPVSIQYSESNCGLVSAWWVLNYFNISIEPLRIIKKTRHSQKNGVFMICLAVALQEFGLDCQMYTERDGDLHLYERFAYKQAEKLGMVIRKAVSLKALISKINKTGLGIILYELDGKEAHISPFVVNKQGKLDLIYPNFNDKLRIVRLNNAWSRKGINRQAIVINGKK